MVAQWQKSVGRQVLAPTNDSLQHCKPQLLTIDDHDDENYDHNHDDNDDDDDDDDGGDDDGDNDQTKTFKIKPVKQPVKSNKMNQIKYQTHQ